MASSTAKAITKSTTPDSTVAMGMIRRGKYTLVIKLALPTKLFDDWARPLAKNIHGTNAAYVKIGYGTPSDGIFPSLPKKMLNTTIVKNGWMIDQAAPSAVCLYRTFTSRQTRK